MEYIVIIISSILLLIVLAYIIDLNIKKVKQIAENSELNKLANNFPQNLDICKAILQKLNNTKVNVKEDNESKTSLYIIVGNTITIANIKDSFTRVQTIAHECIHSVQSKKMLWFNFIFTNLYILYFLIISILTIFKIINNSMMYLVILLLLGTIHYFIRSMLETEAMIKARYVAKEYMLENEICSRTECERIVKEYDRLNDVGIKLVNYDILARDIIKIVIYSIICII